MWQVSDQKVRRRKLYEEVADKIESWIRVGHFQVGDRLPSERELMKTLGIGRTAVREALFALNRMGIIEVNSGGRAVVTRPDATVILGELSGVVNNLLRDPEGQRQFQDARQFWEAAVARRAATMASDADVEDLERYLLLNEKAISDPEEFARTDVAFHDRLAAICGNPLFNALNGTLAEWLTEQRLTSLRKKETAARAFKSHQRIFDAIRRRDPDAAEKAMNAHLAEVSETYWNALRQAG